MTDHEEIVIEGGEHLGAHFMPFRDHLLEAGQDLFAALFVRGFEPTRSRCAQEYSAVGLR